MIHKYEQTKAKINDELLHAYFEKVRKDILPEKGCRWIETGYPIAVTVNGKTTVFVTFSGPSELTNFNFLEFDKVIKS